MGTIAKPSVQSLLIEMQFNGQPLSTGTAFIVNTPTKGLASDNYLDRSATTILSG